MPSFSIITNFLKVFDPLQTDNFKKYTSKPNERWCRILLKKKGAFPPPPVTWLELGEKGQHDPPPTTHHPPPVLREGSLKIFSEKKLKKFTYLNIKNKSVLYFSVFLFYF